MADENFYYLYFSFFIFIIGIYFLINLRKIIFSRNFIIKNDFFDSSKLNKKDMLSGEEEFVEETVINYEDNF